MCSGDGDSEMVCSGLSPVWGTGAKALEDKVFAEKPGGPLCATGAPRERALSQLEVGAGQLPGGGGNLLKDE